MGTPARNNEMNAQTKNASALGSGRGTASNSCQQAITNTTNNLNTPMRVTNPRIPLTILGLVASCGLVLAIHAGQARSGATATILSKPSTDAPSSQWHWQNPLPQGNNLRGASFVDANTGTVVGEYGTIVRTTDGGNSWTIQASGTTQTLWAVSFTDANNGTAVGEGGTIVRTTDGGTHWTSQASGTTLQLRGVSFTDANNGAAVG